MSTWCAVVRHCEREDAPHFRWAAPAGRVKPPDYPLDPLLSANGLFHAGLLAQDMLADAGGGAPDVVVSSPYARCVQTALALCRGFGPRVRLVLDVELGELYGFDVMGEKQPGNVLRPLTDLLSTADWLDDETLDNLRAGRRTRGTWPTWPESLHQARLRFAGRFITYLHRARVTGKNFVFVTHGDGVAAALSVMPSMAGASVCRIDNGAFFVARRTHARAPDLAQEVLLRRRFELFRGKAAGDEADSTESDASTAEPVSPRPRAAPSWWKVHTCGVDIGSPLGEDPGELFGHYIRKWARRARYSERHILELVMPSPSESSSEDDYWSPGYSTVVFDGGTPGSGANIPVALPRRIANGSSMTTDAIVRVYGDVPCGPELAEAGSSLGLEASANPCGDFFLNSPDFSQLLRRRLERQKTI